MKQVRLSHEAFLLVQRSYQRQTGNIVSWKHSGLTLPVDRRPGVQDLSTFAIWWLSRKTQGCIGVRNEFHKCQWSPEPSPPIAL